MHDLSVIVKKNRRAALQELLEAQAEGNSLKKEEIQRSNPDLDSIAVQRPAPVRTDHRNSCGDREEEIDD